MKRGNSRWGIRIPQIKILILNTLGKECREWLLFVADVWFWLITIKLSSAKDKHNGLLLFSYTLPTFIVDLLNTIIFIWYFFNLLVSYLGQISDNVDIIRKLLTGFWRSLSRHWNNSNTEYLLFWTSPWICQ